DDPRPFAWRYRDYVIHSFNDDKPYDRFLREQLAGDELYPDDPEAVVATGFNRHFPDEYNAVNLEQRRQEILNDVTDTTAAAFMGPACRRPPLPRPQVPPDPAARLLPPAGLLRRLLSRRCARGPPRGDGALPAAVGRVGGEDGRRAAEDGGIGGAVPQAVRGE